MDRSAATGISIFIIDRSDSGAIVEPVSSTRPSSIYNYDMAPISVTYKEPEYVIEYSPSASNYKWFEPTSVHGSGVDWCSGSTAPGGFRGIYWIIPLYRAISVWYAVAASILG